MYIDWRQYVFFGSHRQLGKASDEDNSETGLLLSCTLWCSGQAFIQHLSRCGVVTHLLSALLLGFELCMGWGSVLLIPVSPVLRTGAGTE